MEEEKEVEKKELELFLSEKARAHNMSAKKIAELSGIPLKHVEHLLSGRYESLPPAPYLHGYLTRLGTLLEFDGEVWWGKLKEDGALVGSGPEDRLPENRFARMRMPRYLWAIAGAVILIFYFILRGSFILGTPTLTVMTPQDIATTASTNQVTIRGKTEHADTVRVNGEPASMTPDGFFEALILLEPGVNTVEITAAKFLGREKKAVYQIVYEPPLQSTSTAKEEEEPGTLEINL